MALLLKNGAIFVHIPKTGGNWVRKVLKDNNLVKGEIKPKHADIDRILLPIYTTRRALISYAVKRFFNLHRYPYKKPFMFCFVRHPLSWYESYFKYMSQKSHRWKKWGDEMDVFKWHPNAMLNGLESDDFNQFMQNVINKRPGYVTEFFGWYTKPQIDFIGKQENIVEDLIKVLRIMKLDFNENNIRKQQRLNVSPDPENKIEWDEDLKQEVFKLEYAGLKRYGYL